LTPGCGIFVAEAAERLHYWEMSEAERSKSDLLTRIKDAATVFAIALTGLYAVGVLVTNMYLWNFHYEDFNLLRPRCILTGAWSCLVLGCCALPGLWIDTQFGKEFPEKRKWLDIVSTAVLLAAGCLVAGLLMLNFLGVGKYPTSYFGTSDILIVQYVISSWLLEWMLVLSGLLCLRTLVKHWIENAKPNKSMGQIFSVFILLFAIAAIAFCLDSFSTSAYRRIDSAVGGGRPKPANLVLNKDGVAFWKLITTPSTTPPDMLVTGYVYVYHETESQLLVRLCECVRPQGDLVVIDKRMVSGIIPELRDPTTITAGNARPVNAPSAVQKK
jgi:hypothetical protein